MAVKLIANYAKRLGLPGFSSHQFSISLEIELVDLGQAQGESARLYGLLQDAVDREIQHVGFVPPDGYGLEDTSGNRNSGATNNGTNGNGHWSCSDKQRELILKLVGEHGLDRNVVEETAHERFGVGVKMLNKLQASGLISELIETAEKGGRKSRAVTPTKGGRR